MCVYVCVCVACVHACVRMCVFVCVCFVYVHVYRAAAPKKKTSLEALFDDFLWRLYEAGHKGCYPRWQ